MRNEAPPVSPLAPTADRTTEQYRHTPRHSSESKHGAVGWGGFQTRWGKSTSRTKQYRTGSGEAMSAKSRAWKSRNCQEPGRGNKTGGSGKGVDGRGNPNAEDNNSHPNG